MSAGPSTGPAGERALAGEAISRLTNTDNGLEVRKWLVPVESGVFAAAFEPIAEANAVDDQTTDLLQANGLRLLRVNRQQLDMLHASLGTLAMDATAWFGQVTQWRPLHSKRLAGTPVTVAVDGRVRRISDGALQLGIRSWTVPMEDAAIVQIELALHQRITRSQRDLRRLVERGSGDDVRAISAMRVDVPLAVDEVLVLASIHANDEIEKQAGGDDAADTADEAAAAVEMGPLVEPPLTIGPWLLDTQQPQPMRAVYVFQARIPAHLFPESQAAGRDVRGGE